MKNFVWVVGTIALLMACAVFAGLYLLNETPPDQQATLRVEAIKFLMQLVVVGFVGGLITWTLNERSKHKDRAIADEIRRKDQAREDEQRRDAEELAAAEKRVEKRDALNQLRRAADARLVATTNTVRKARILIESHRSKKTYGEQVRSIIDARLDLSDVRHEEESSPLFTNSAGVIEAIRVMERRLDAVINEWKASYHRLHEDPKEGWPQISALPEVADLLSLDEHSKFYTEYMDQGYRVALNLIRNDILKAADAPTQRAPSAAG